VCRYVHCGHFEDHNYLVMELLGENLSELRRKRPNGKFSLNVPVLPPPSLNRRRADWQFK
jgi:hypothetical protein